MLKLRIFEIILLQGRQVEKEEMRKKTWAKFWGAARVRNSKVGAPGLPG